MPVQIGWNASASVTEMWTKFLRGGRFVQSVKYVKYYFKDMYHGRLFTPLNITIHSNVAQRHWLIWKRISEENGCSLTKYISQPSIDSLIRTLHRELTAKLFTSACRLCCFCVQQKDGKKMCLSETDRQTGRDTYSVMSFYKTFSVCYRCRDFMNSS